MSIPTLPNNHFTCKTAGLSALHEIHVFCGDVNPSEGMIAKYQEAVAEWNALHSDAPHPMKACVLALLFRDGKDEKEVVVLQCARYFRSDSTEETIAEAHKDALFLREHGLETLRVKIEATAYGMNGVPLTKTESDALGRYYEFHVKVTPKEGKVHDFGELQEVSKELGQRFGIPVPFSYNKIKHQVPGDYQGGQMFLNVRFRSGLDCVKGDVKVVTDAIDAKTNYKVVKVISEYVWYDTDKDGTPGAGTAMDHGWIDFTEEEWEAAN